VHNTSQAEQIRNNIRLNFLVKRRITTECWGQIDLDQPRFELTVYQNIEAKQFKAISLEGTKHINTIVDHIFCRNKRFYNNVVDFSPELFIIYP